jgi:hypothetical protein
MQHPKAARKSAAVVVCPQSYEGTTSQSLFGRPSINLDWRCGP